MFNKCFILVGFIMAVGVVGNQTPAGSTATPRYVGKILYIGGRHFGDRKLTEQPVYVAASRNRTISHVVDIHANIDITYIAAVDETYRIYGESEATPTLVSSRLGKRNATLLLTSKVGEAIYFRVSSYGLE